MFGFEKILIPAVKPFLGKRYSRIGSTHSYVQGDRAKAIEAIITEMLPKAKKVSVPCLCGKNNSKDILLAEIDRWGLPATTVLCTQCGLIRIHPRWDDATYDRIYRKYFWPLQVGAFDISYDRFNLSVKRAQPFVEYLKSHVDLKGKNILEIGCSYGAGLYSLKNNGAQLTGYDYDERILKIGKKYTELNLKQGGLQEALKDGIQFDIIILRHVLEHFLYPLNEFEKIKLLLRDHGVLFIEVPGIFNLQEVTYDPLMYFNAFHIFSFSLKNLIRLLNIASFELVHGDERIFSLWKKKEGSIKVNWEDEVLVEKIKNYVYRLESNYRRRHINILYPLFNIILRRKKSNKKVN